MRAQEGTDRRKFRLSLRRKGREVLHLLAKRRWEKFRRLFGHLNRTDVERLLEALATLNELLSRWHDDRSPGEQRDVIAMSTDA